MEDKWGGGAHGVAVRRGEGIIGFCQIADDIIPHAMTPQPNRAQTRRKNALQEFAWLISRPFFLAMGLDGKDANVAINNETFLHS